MEKTAFLQKHSAALVRIVLFAAAWLLFWFVLTKILWRTEGDEDAAYVSLGIRMYPALLLIQVFLERLANRKQIKTSTRWVYFLVFTIITLALWQVWTWMFFITYAALTQMKNMI
jgi:hypothetical protein